MIEIDTIQDIREIESKIIGGFTGRQLIAIGIGIIIDIILFLTTHSIHLILFASLAAFIFGFFKKGNLTAREYFMLMWDKQKQPKVRSYKNKNIILEIEKQCRIYKTSQKKQHSNNIFRKKKVVKNIMLALIFCSFPIVAKATTIDTDIEGYTGMLNTMKIYVRGTGGIVLLIGSGEFFINLAHENTDRLAKAMQVMGAGFFLILADSFVKAIGNANGSQTFAMLFEMIGLIISFIGAVFTMLGAYNCMTSAKERNAEGRNRAIKIMFSGLMLVAISRSLATFLL